MATIGATIEIERVRLYQSSPSELVEKDLALTQLNTEEVRVISRAPYNDPERGPVTALDLEFEIGVRPIEPSSSATPDLEQVLGSLSPVPGTWPRMGIVLTSRWRLSMF